MAVRTVLKMGDGRLWQRAQPVRSFNTPELHTLIADMEETMHHFDGVGLAAPQIGVDLRLVIFGFRDDPRCPDADGVPYTVLINPVLTPLSEALEEGWEGCLSVPGLRGLVPRWRSLRYSGVDQFGTPVERSVEGFHARVVQHECDHLDGVLYPMRITDLRQFGFAEVLFPDEGEQADD